MANWLNMNIMKMYPQTETKVTCSPCSNEVPESMICQFFPCGHKPACISCVSQYAGNTCPHCHADVTSVKYTLPSGSFLTDLKGMPAVRLELEQLAVESVPAIFFFGDPTSGKHAIVQEITRRCPFTNAASKQSSFAPNAVFTDAGLRAHPARLQALPVPTSETPTNANRTLDAARSSRVTLYVICVQYNENPIDEALRSVLDQVALFPMGPPVVCLVTPGENIGTTDANDDFLSEIALAHINALPADHHDEPIDHYSSVDSQGVWINNLQVLIIDRLTSVNF